MKTIMFDERCAGWSKNVEWNKMFLHIQKEYLNERLRSKGYMYLNGIYESLGASWDPDEENICYRARDGLLNIEFEPVGDNAFLVKIYH